jgi:hypothetical protein
MSSSEAGAVGSLDTDANVQAEATAVIAAKHVLGVVGLPEAVAPEPSGPAGDGAECPYGVSRETFE